MPLWLSEAAVKAMYAQLIREHGGAVGPINENKLGATLARPKQRDHYNQSAISLAELAAAYGFGFAKNHCFVDGNKRVALAAIDVFLQRNGFELVADEADAVITIQALAAGSLEEHVLAEWISSNMREL